MGKSTKVKGNKAHKNGVSNGKLGLKHKIIPIVLALVLIIQTIILAIQPIFATNYTSQGSTVSLGSPLLNNSMQADKFNKWETICWGIYLSNYVTPFCDTYVTAFNSGTNEGSNGAGSQSLQFSAGSDQTNKTLITNLLNYAINLELNTAPKPIYAVYNEIADGKTTRNPVLDTVATPPDPNDPNTDTGILGAQALVSELFLGNVVDDKIKVDLGGTTMKIEPKGYLYASADTPGSFPICSGVEIAGIGYPDMTSIMWGSVPTFVIKDSSGALTPVLDFTDAYDIQATNLLMAKALSGKYAEQAQAGLSEIISNNTQLYLDCYGNIVTKNSDGKYVMVVPAAFNQHLTEVPKKNLINSLVLNGQTSVSNSLDLIRRGGAEAASWLSKALAGVSTGNKAADLTGFPAFGNSLVSSNIGAVAIYYDTDTVYGLAASDVLTQLPDLKKTLTTSNITAGKALETVLNSNINSSTTQIPFKIETCNLIDTLSDGVFKSKQLAQFSISASIYSNQANLTKQTEVNTTLDMLYDSRKSQDIFGEKVAVSPMSPTVQKGKIDTNTFVRQFVDYVYQIYNGGVVSSKIPVDRTWIRDTIANAKTTQDIFLNLTFVDGKAEAGAKATPLLRAFFDEKGLQPAASNRLWSNMIDMTKEITYSKPWSKGGNPAEILSAINWVKEGTTEPIATASSNCKDADFKFMGRGANAFTRVAVVHESSPVLTKVADVLNIHDGANFETYATDIYYTYLRFYGILNDFGASTTKSLFNTKIFDEALINDTTTIQGYLTSNSYLTSEQKMQSILDGTYSLLAQSLDRDYSITDFIYNQYYKLVYGRSQSASVSGDLSAKGANGFLQIHTYDENFLTSYFIRNYAKFSAILIGVICILVILSGLLNKRKGMWFLSTIFIAVNIILIVPATGEITPYVCNKLVQNTFSDNMTYWSISESLNNSKLEGEANKSNDEATKLSNEIIKSHRGLNLDHTLMLKLDISKKVTSVDTTDYNKLQQLQTTRWLLPSIIQQWSADDGSSDYVQVTNGSELDNLSNMYWYYSPEDASNVNTVAAKQTTTKSFTSGSSTVDEAGNTFDKFQTSIRSRYIDYQEMDGSAEYQSYLYTQTPGITHRPSNYSYILDGNYILPARGQWSSQDTWKNFKNTTLASSTLEPALLDSAKILEATGGAYDPNSRDSLDQSHGYLWATQNPYHYFYQVIKETFASDSSMGSLYTDLAGTYVLSESTGKKDIRQNDILFNLTDSDGDTGNGYSASSTRDILDLEHLFTNTIPYLYEMTVATGGLDGSGTDGVLGNKKIEQYALYENNYKSWLFRSNWVIKILESPEYGKSCTVYDKDNNKHTVTNQALPDAYPATRPMVFSQAQMVSQGLSKSDLSIVELKCLECNNSTAEKWTSMINYLSIKDMTPEVLFRQMSTDALLNFNKQFSPTTMTSGKYALYPSTLDLRYISFDSIMRMLMLNISNNTNYMGNDTMSVIIRDSDIFTCFTLLLAALLCSGLIPLLRDILMGVIFYLGFIAILRSIFGKADPKIKASTGYILTNLVFCVATYLYYSTFSLMINMTTSDAVIGVSSAAISAGSPLWCFILVIAFSLLYIAAIGAMLLFCFKNYKDMGFEVYASIASSVTERFNEAATSIGSGVSSLLHHDSSSDDAKAKAKARDISGSGSKAADQTITAKLVKGEQGGTDSDSANDSPNHTSKTSDNYDFEDTAAIEREMQRGKDELTEADLESELAKAETEQSATEQET